MDDELLEAFRFGGGQPGRFVVAGVAPVREAGPHGRGRGLLLSR